MTNDPRNHELDQLVERATAALTNIESAGLTREAQGHILSHLKRMKQEAHSLLQLVGPAPDFRRDAHNPAWESRNCDNTHAIARGAALSMLGLAQTYDY